MMAKREPTLGGGDASDYRRYRVNASDREPLIEFMTSALEMAGCTIIEHSPASEAPFRITFATSAGERIGILAYAFLANQKQTRNRPDDEHRFQMKYGSESDEVHTLWQDPFGLYTTLLVGIDLERNIFVGADPWLHHETRFFKSVFFKRHDVDEIERLRWHSWERERRKKNDDEPVETLVGGTADSFLRYVRFEREALREEQGNRALTAEDFGNLSSEALIMPTLAAVSANRVHHLAKEFALGEQAVLDLIANAPRLKMAVRGWVAEEHLVGHLQRIDGVDGCQRQNIEGAPDVVLRYRGSQPIQIECKNVLRARSAAGLPRLDFQRTRASKTDPCSRYYSPTDFDVVAACLHAVGDGWTYRFVEPTLLRHREGACSHKLANNVVIDERWSGHAEAVLAAVAARQRK